MRRAARTVWSRAPAAAPLGGAHSEHDFGTTIGPQLSSPLLSSSLLAEGKFQPDEKHEERVANWNLSQGRRALIDGQPVVVCNAKRAARTAARSLVFAPAARHRRSERKNNQLGDKLPSKWRGRRAIKRRWTRSLASPAPLARSLARPLATPMIGSDEEPKLRPVPR